MFLGPNPMDKVSGALNNCSRKVGEATRHAENMVDNLWNHGEFSSFCPIATSLSILKFLLDLIFTRVHAIESIDP